MINKDVARKYCNGNIEDIENYDKASNDKTAKWVIHHKGEILPCGVNYAKTLVKYGLYFNRPASELIFLTPSQHAAIHNNVNKIGNDYRKGKAHTTQTKLKISKANSGHVMHESTRLAIHNSVVGTHWYTNGIENVRSNECPIGFHLGRTIRKEI